MKASLLVKAVHLSPTYAAACNQGTSRELAKVVIWLEALSRRATCVIVTIVSKKSITTLRFSRLIHLNGPQVVSNYLPEILLNFRLRVPRLSDSGK